MHYNYLRPFTFRALIQLRFLFMGCIPFLFSNSSLGQDPLVKQWDHRYGGNKDDQLYCLQQTINGGYILGGWSFSGQNGDKSEPSWGDRDYWIVKTDSLGIKEWDKRYGGTEEDLLYAVLPLQNGDYILGGHTLSGISGDKTQPLIGAWDYWIIKVDSDGIPLWNKGFGGISTDKLMALDTTFDGGYILGGYSDSPVGGDKSEPSWGSYDYWIIKVDSLGTKQWDKRFGGTGPDYITNVRQTADSGYILAGYSSSPISGDKTETSQGYNDYWIVKTDALGNYQWDRRFGGDGEDFMVSLEFSNDGGYFLAGYSYSGMSGDKTQPNWMPLNHTCDLWILKIDSVGTQLWDRRYGWTGSERLGNLSLTSDNGLLLSGSSDSQIGGDKSEANLGVSNSWVIGIDQSGNKLWDKVLLTAGDDGSAQGLQTTGNCFVFANYSPADSAGEKTQDSWGNGSFDYWITKFCDTSLAYFFPTSVFAVSDPDICEKFCINFFDQSTNNPSSWQWLFPGGIPSSSVDENPVNICYNDSGTYDVTLISTNTFGSDTVVLSNFITVYSTPPIPSIAQNGYTLTATSAYSYQWQLNSTDIPGATNQSYDVQQSGLYTVITGDPNGCVNSASTYVGITGIFDEADNKDIAVIPNPSDGNFLVMLQNMSEVQIRIQIFNPVGEKIFLTDERITDPSFEKEINLPASLAGIYFLSIATPGKIWNKKIIIQ
jgi:hypothetical protein